MARKNEGRGQRCIFRTNYTERLFTEYIAKRSGLTYSAFVALAVREKVQRYLKLAFEGSINVPNDESDPRYRYLYGMFCGELFFKIKSLDEAKAIGPRSRRKAINHDDYRSDYRRRPRRS